MLAAKARAELGHLADALGAAGLIGIVSGGARREARELAPAAGEDVAGFRGLLLQSAQGISWNCKKDGRFSTDRRA